MPDFIRERGGIDAIRKAEANSETTKSAASNNKALHKALSNQLLERCKTPLGVVEFGDGKQHTIGGSGDVTFTYLIAVSGYGKPGVQIVGTIYPSAQIEQMALNLYSTVSTVAAHEGTPSFWEACNEYGLNQDMVLRWMKENGLPTSKHAKALLSKVRDESNLSVT